MSKECIKNCPNIADCIDGVQSDETESSIIHVPVGGDNLDSLMKWCADSYDCSGPKLTEEQVVKGIFRKRTETQEVYICLHPDQPSS